MVYNKRTVFIIKINLIEVFALKSITTKVGKISVT